MTKVLKFLRDIYLVDVDLLPEHNYWLINGLFQN